MQMHAGNEVEVYFKDIEIKAPKREGADKTEKTSPKKIESAAERGAELIVLPGRNAKIVGEKLKYMPEWDALGFWDAGNDAVWEVEVKQAGNYDVMMEWSVDDQNAGKEFVLEAGGEKFQAKVESSKRWDTYRIEVIGKLKLDAGTQKITMHPVGDFKGALMDLRELRLTSAGKKKG
jgi:hypothetical protein